MLDSGDSSAPAMLPPRGFLQGIGSVALRATNKVKEADKKTVFEQEDVDHFYSQDASEITPFLFLAGNLVAKNKELLLKLKVTNVINTARMVCPDYFIKEGTFEYLSFELVDNAAESISSFMLRTIVEIERVRKRGGITLVHCHQGVSRSCTLVIAYLMWKDGIGFEEAFQYVKQRRSICSPNAGFISQLMEWEKKLKTPLTFPTLYLFAPHSERDHSLVVKPFSLSSRTDELSDTNTYFLHVPEAQILYILLGSHPEGEQTIYEKASLTFAGWMTEYEPCYKGSTIVQLPIRTEEFSKYLNQIRERL